MPRYNMFQQNSCGNNGQLQANLAQSHQGENGSQSRGSQKCTEAFSRNLTHDKYKSVLTLEYKDMKQQKQHQQTLKCDPPRILRAQNSCSNLKGNLPVRGVHQDFSKH